MPAKEKPGDRPIGVYDPARAKREMSRPVISPEMKATAKRVVRGVVSAPGRMARDFMKSHREGMKSLRGKR